MLRNFVLVVIHNHFYCIEMLFPHTCTTPTTLSDGGCGDKCRFGGDGIVSGYNYYLVQWINAEYIINMDKYVECVGELLF